MVSVFEGGAGDVIVLAPLVAEAKPDVEKLGCGGLLG